MSTLSAAIKASGSALSAERARIEVAVSNLANAGTTAGSEATAYRAMKPVFRTVMDEQGRATVQVDQTAYYIEDSWNITDDFVAYLGLRWDTFDNKNGAGQSYVKIDNQFAPRLGFSWDVFGDSTFKVFGNAGRYALPLTPSVAVRGASASLFSRQNFNFTGVDPVTGAPLGLTPRGPVAYLNAETGEPHIAETVASKNLKPMYQDEYILGFQKQLTDVQIERADLEAEFQEISRLERSGESFLSLPRVAQDKGVQDLLSQANGLEKDLERLSVTYLDKHPRVVEVRTQRDDVRRKIDTEVDRIISNVKVEYSLAMQNEPQSVLFGQRIVDGALFPLVLLVLGFVARGLLARFVPLAVFHVAIPVLVSLAVIRLGVKVLQVAFDESPWVRVLERTISWVAWAGMVLWVSGLLPLMLAEAQDVGGIKVLAKMLDGADPKTLRDTVDQLKNKLGSAALVLATVQDSKVSLVAGVTKDSTDRIKAGDLVNFVAQQVGGKGGGRPDMAQAGGNDPSALPKALAAVPDWVRQKLGA